MLDLEPAARVLAELVAGVRDDQLTAPTPCAESSLGDLLDHIDGLALAFTAAAAKTPLDGAPSADGSRLGADDWRTRIPSRLAALAEAWRAEAPWTGMTSAGGVTMPGEVAGLVALDEIVVHGWDLAVASGQSYDCDPALIAGAMTFVESAVAQHPEGTPGLFGPPVAVADDAPPLDRLIGLTGRDPAWHGQTYV